MSECEAYQEYFSAGLDGELSEEETQALRVHVENCPDCRAVCAAFTFVENALPDAFPEVPAGLHEHILSGVRQAASRQTPHETNTPRRNKPQLSPRRIRSAVIAAACLVLVITGAALSGRFLRMGRSGGSSSASLSNSSQAADAGGMEDGVAFDTTAAQEEMEKEAPEVAEDTAADEVPAENAAQRLEGVASFAVFMDDESREGADAVAVVDEFFDSGPTDKVLNLSVVFSGEAAYSVQLWYRGGKAVCSLNEDGIEVRSLEDILAYFRG